MACVMHRFGPDNKCSGCGRWKPGCAPKKQFIKDRAECQVCEALWALTQGNLGHHGYQRPGFGYIVGDCAGQGHAPFPATNALEGWLKTVQAKIKNCTQWLKDLPNEAILTRVNKSESKYGFSRGEIEYRTYTFEVRKVDGFYRNKTVRMRQGEVYEDPREGEYNRNQRLRDEQWTKDFSGKYEHELKRQIMQTEQELRFWVKEEQRVTERIAKGVAMRAAGQTTVVAAAK